MKVLICDNEIDYKAHNMMRTGEGIVSSDGVTTAIEWKPNDDVPSGN